MYPRMDINQQKIACGVITGVAIFSATVGFLCMFAISESSLSMMSRLNRNPVEDESYVTQRIFEKIRSETFLFSTCQNAKYVKGPAERLLLYLLIDI